MKLRPFWGRVVPRCLQWKSIFFFFLVYVNGTLVVTFQWEKTWIKIHTLSDSGAGGGRSREVRWGSNDTTVGTETEKKVGQSRAGGWEGNGRETTKIVSSIIRLSLKVPLSVTYNKNVSVLVRRDTRPVTTFPCRPVFPVTMSSLRPLDPDQGRDRGRPSLWSLFGERKPESEGTDIFFLQGINIFESL